MTALATLPGTKPRRAGFDIAFQLAHKEPLAVGLKRVAMSQFERAASRFFDGEDELGSAIHESRRAIKRVRALLRLVRGELGEKIFGYEDSSLGDTGRLIAEVRSTAAMHSAALLIRELYGEFLAPATFEEMVALLARKRDLVFLNTLEDPHLIGRVVRNFERAHGRYSTWPTDPDAGEVYGMGIRDSFAAIGPGLVDTYGRGRRGMATAYKNPTASSFHEWRKRVKYLRYQLEFLAPLWPEVLIGAASTLDRIGMILGEEHDLAELLGLLRDRPDLCPNGRERSLFSALVAQRRFELQMAAEILGRRVYAEKPVALESRFGEYWDARRLASRLALETLVVY